MSGDQRKISRNATYCQESRHARPYVRRVSPSGMEPGLVPEHGAGLWNWNAGHFRSLKKGKD